MSKKNMDNGMNPTQEPPALNMGLAEALKEKTEELERRAREIKALMNGARTVLEQKGFVESARAIFDYCTNLIGATSGYVALLSEDGMENEVLFLEAGGLPCSVDPSLPMPIRGLRERAYVTNQAVYDNDFMGSQWIQFIPAGHVVLKNVMFAPLVIDGKTVGIMGLANKPGDFDDNDAKLAGTFGELAAIALRNSRNIDEKTKAEKEREQVIEELKAALTQVKKLSGLLPICSICKKIRDDKGYWNRIEKYLEEHSEAMLTHSLCPACIKVHYPDLDIPTE
jgi:nitrate/nitrite-specific signal transduction histidine kinase